jgi:hypothetical protein
MYDMIFTIIVIGFNAAELKKRVENGKNEGFILLSGILVLNVIRLFVIFVYKAILSQKKHQYKMLEYNQEGLQVTNSNTI